MSDLKIVFHIDQADRWPATFGNLNNLTRDYPDANIRVVANGSGIYALTSQSDLLEKLEHFADKHVTIQACNNALKEHHVDPATLPAFVEVVPAGVVAVAQAQQEGFAYIKP